MSRTTNRRHLKRPSAPNTWSIPRKGSKFIVKPSPGPHSMELGMPLLLWLRDYLKYAKSAREAKYLINSGKVLVDGRKVRDYAFPVGLFDVISFPDLGKHYRVLMNSRKKLFLHPIDEKEAGIKVARIIRKQMVKGGKVQLTSLDGRNFLVDDPKKYYTGDTLVISIPDQKILQHIPMKEGALIYIYFGAKVGSIGTLTERRIEHKSYGNTRFIKYKDYKTGEEKETIEEYAVVIGEEKPVISFPENI